MISSFYISSGWIAMLFAITILSVVYGTIKWAAVAKYHLPISLNLVKLSLLMSVVNFLAHPIALVFLNKYTKDHCRNAFKIAHLCLFWVAMLSLDIVLATLAFGYLSGQECSLAEQWQIMFSQKSIQIKTIEEAFKCCGFKTIKDRAYPFPDAHNSATTCTEQYGYTKPCAPALANANEEAAMTFFLIFLSAVITKVIFGYIMLLYKTGRAIYPEIVEDWLGEVPNLDHENLENRELLTEHSGLLNNDERRALADE